MFFSQSQPKAVHADDGETVVIDFKKGAGVDWTSVEIAKEVSLIIERRILC